MAIKDILLHLDAGETAQAANEFAASLAERLEAHLTAAVVVTEIPPNATEMGIFTPSGDLGGIDILAEIDRKRREAMEEAYEKFKAGLPPTVPSELVVIKSFQAKARDDFAHLARHFDLTVVLQRQTEPGQTCELMLSSALFDSGRPIFVTPPDCKGPAKLDKAMVCWDAGAQAARALAESLPLLALAQSVEVVCVCGEPDKAPALPGFNIARHLARHGIEANLTELPSGGDVGATLLRHAREIGADYLVMGGFGHGRLTELILGGATRRALALSRMPIFMAH